MAFGDNFASSLGDSLGVSIDPSGFGEPDAIAQQLADFQSYTDGLDDVSRASLNALVESGIDLSQAEDEEGPLDLPGGSIFAVAASAQRPVEEIATAVQTSIDTAIGQA